jgi:hypothetical protein
VWSRRLKPGAVHCGELTRGRRTDVEYPSRSGSSQDACFAGCQIDPNQAADLGREYSAPENGRSFYLATDRPGRAKYYDRLGARIVRIATREVELMRSRFGATAAINNKDGKAVEQIMKMTDGRDGAVASDQSLASDHWTTVDILWRLSACCCRIGCTGTANTAALIS